MIHNQASTKSHREIILALESARTRLAVAIAAERKSTPPDRSRYFLETAELTRRFIRNLRNCGSDAFQDGRDWIPAINMLNQIPGESEALHLCRILRSIVKEPE